jgi:preprotein translocase subunit SecB
MADEIDLGANPENGFGDEPMPQVAIITQYVKDLSFENPNAPGSLQVQSQPRIDVNVGVNARKAADDVYEVELKISAKAVPEEAIEPFCIIEGPRILFPFARRIIADAVRDGGFPPLMLDPIDFSALYMSQQGQVGNA